MVGHILRHTSGFGPPAENVAAQPVKIAHGGKWYCMNNNVTARADATISAGGFFTTCLLSRSYRGMVSAALRGQSHD